MDSTTTANTPPPTTPFNQESWDRWIARGRAQDVAGRRTMRRLALVVVAAAGVAAALWLV